MIDENFTILEIIEKSSSFLRKKGVPNPKCDAEWLISFAIKKSRLDIYLCFEDLVKKEDLSKIREYVVKRGNRIPLQHILGTVNFNDSIIKVDKRSLIPRPETEQLAEKITRMFPKLWDGNILDLGTGSGAIIVSLCNQFRKARGWGYEKSEESLNHAKENVELNKLENVIIEEFDWNVDRLKNKYDLIVSNPPYLTKEEWQTAQPEVHMYDPVTALVANNDGKEDIFKIIEIAENHLLKNGYLAIEIGAEHKISVVKKLSAKFTEIEVIKDYNGFERFIIAKLCNIT